jgi:hypothetical protein
MDARRGPSSGTLRMRRSDQRAFHRRKCPALRPTTGIRAREAAGIGARATACGRTRGKKAIGHRDRGVHYNVPARV